MASALAPTFTFGAVYPDDPNDMPIVGLVWTLCNELLIDPAGYVYDVTTAGGAVDWPEVPPGQYRVEAAATGCARYTSPILTVVDAPIFHNVGLRCSSAAQIGVSYDAFLPTVVVRKE
jgi:hypothetical protein